MNTVRQLRPLVRQSRPHRDRKRDGQELVEWGLVLALVAVVAAGTLSTTGQNISAVFDTINQQLDDSEQILESDGLGGGIGGDGGVR